MQGLLAKIYDMVISRELDSIVFGRRFDEEVSKIDKPLRQEMSDKEVECIKEIIYAATYMSEKQGFYLDVYTAMKFMLEVTIVPDEYK